MDEYIVFDVTLFDLFGLLQGSDVMLWEKVASFSFRGQRSQSDISAAKNPFSKWLQLTATKKHTNPLKIKCNLEKWTAPLKQSNVSMYRGLLRQNCWCLVQWKLQKDPGK